jgi:four helix bundle protein
VIKLEKITAYKIASDLSDEIWNIVSNWSLIAKKTVGEQLIKSTDSIAANIAEAEGRHFKKDKMRFLYQARGSLYETGHWLDKAMKRKLINKIQFTRLMKELRLLPKEVNFLIANISKNLKV